MPILHKNYICIHLRKLPTAHYFHYQPTNRFIQSSHLFSKATAPLVFHPIRLLIIYGVIELNLFIYFPNGLFVVVIFGSPLAIVRFSIAPRFGLCPWMTPDLHISFNDCRVCCPRTARRVVCRPRSCRVSCKSCW